MQRMGSDPFYGSNVNIVLQPAFFLPPATKLGQGNIFRGVCQEFCSQGGCRIPACLAGTPPAGTLPPARYTSPWPGTPIPPAGNTPGQVCILLECILVQFENSGFRNICCVPFHQFRFSTSVYAINTNMILQTVVTMFVDLNNFRRKDARIPALITLVRDYRPLTKFVAR